MGIESRGNILMYNTHMPAVTFSKHLQGLVWTKKSEHLDVKQDKAFIIHHVLRYGRIDDISWLLKTYTHEELTQVFLTQPMTIYSPSSLHFAKKTILNITEDLPYEQRYIQSFS